MIFHGCEHGWLKISHNSTRGIMNNAPARMKMSWYTQPWRAVFYHWYTIDFSWYRWVQYWRYSEVYPFMLFIINIVPSMPFTMLFCIMCLVCMTCYELNKGWERREGAGAWAVWEASGAHSARQGDDDSDDDVDIYSDDDGGDFFLSLMMLMVSVILMVMTVIPMGILMNDLFYDGSDTRIKCGSKVRFFMKT